MKRKQFVGLRLWLWVGIIFFLCSMPSPEVKTPAFIPYMDKLAHFVLFFVFSIFVFALLQEMKIFKKTVNITHALLFTAAYGALIEWLQGRYFGRSSELWDWVADMLGGIFGIFLYPLLHSWKLGIERHYPKLFLKNRS